MIHSLEYSESLQQDDKKEEEAMVQIEQGSVQQKKLQKMAKVDHGSWKTWFDMIKAVNNVNQSIKTNLYVETQETRDPKGSHTTHLNR